MTAVFSRTAALLGGVALALIFTGCAAQTPPVRPAPAQETAPMPPAPVPVLNVGDSFAVDLIGDGRATVSLTRARVESGDPASPQGTAPFVVTVAMVLDKAGNPITGGPQNFRFRDSQAAYHPARTSKEAFAPELASMNFIRQGQRTQGNVIFDVPADLVSGGEIQLISGQMILAVWKV